jgi:hypothetical protein
MQREEEQRALQVLVRARWVSRGEGGHAEAAAERFVQSEDVGAEVSVVPSATAGSVEGLYFYSRRGNEFELKTTGVAEHCGCSCRLECDRAGWHDIACGARGLRPLTTPRFVEQQHRVYRVETT